MSANNLTIRQIRDILDANGTDYSDCIEKEDYVRKLDQVRSGARPDSAFHADKGGAERGGFKGFGGASRNNHNRNESPPRSGGNRSQKRAEESSSSEHNNNGDVEVIITRVIRTTEYYTILGVPRSASEDEVKRAYKKLALKLHPDKCKHPKAEEAFKKLAGAFNCLSNSDKRSIYDRSGTDPSVGAGGPGGGGGGIDPNDILNAFFRGGGMPGGMRFEFGGPNDFQQFFRPHHQQQQRQRPQQQREDQQVEEQQYSLSSLLRYAPIIFLVLPQLTTVVSSVFRSPWLLLPVALMVPEKLQKPLFAAAAVMFVLNFF